MPQKVPVGSRVCRRVKVRLSLDQHPRGDRIIWPLLAGVLMLLAGFGVIFTFWNAGAWRSDIPGFWTYRSPNIGDGVLLPIAAALLVGGGNKLAPVRYEIAATITGFLLGLAGGAALQFIWLSDPDPLPNWTVPTPHAFNAPGIYHAIFLAVASGFFTGSAVRLLWRAHFNRGANSLRVQRLIASPAAALLIACIAGFACLVALDGHHVHGFTIKNTPTSLSATFITLLAILFAALLVTWGFGRFITGAWRSFAWGLFLAAGIGLVAWDTYETLYLLELPQVLVIALVGATIVLFTWKVHGQFWWIQAIAACLVLMGGLSRSFSLAASSLNLALLVAFATVIAIGIIVGMLRLKQARRYMLGIIFPVLMLVFLVWMSIGSHAATNGRLIAPLLSLLWPIAMLVGVQIYPDLIEDEKAYGSGYLAEQSYWVTYLTLSFLFVAAVISSLELANLPGSVLRAGSAENAYPPYFGIEMLVVCAAVVMAILATWRSHTRKSGQKLPIWPVEPILRPRVATVFWASLAALLWGASPWIASAIVNASPMSIEPSDFRVVIYIAAALYALWLGLITVDSFRANLSLLEFYRLSAGAWIVASAAGLAVASVVSWLWLVGLWEQGDWASYLSIAKVLLIVVVGWVTVIPLCALALERARIPMSAKPPYIGLHRPATQIFNDAIMHGFSLGATVFAILAVSQVVRSVMAATDSAAVLVQILLTLLPFVVVLVPTFIYVISTTGGHIEQESKRLSQSMVERANGDEKLATELRDAMIDRMKRRFDVVESVAFPLSPYGFLALAVNIFKKFIR